jgi:hypothetical protein
MAATFARTILAGSLSISDVDVVVPDKMVTALCFGTGINDEIIRNLGISTRQDILGTVDAISEVRPWVLPLRLATRKRWRKALQICPLCLNEFGYFRQTWRLAFVTCCPIHRAHLLDQCTRCNSRIRVWQFRDNALGRALDLAYACYKCKLPFSELAQEPATRVVIAAQEVMSHALAFRSAIGIGLLKFDAVDGFAFLRRSIAGRTRRRVPSIELQSLATRRQILAPWNDLIVSVPTTHD